jgi:hypothetical protein
VVDPPSSVFSTVIMNPPAPLEVGIPIRVSRDGQMWWGEIVAVEPIYWINDAGEESDMVEGYAIECEMDSE